ncbi:glycosyltransferase, partial [Acinetobacter baumannii]
MISFTIITCTYQAAEVLGRTLDSVLAQSHGRVEHLIIDGLSTDGTVALAEDYR